MKKYVTIATVMFILFSTASCKRCKTCEVRENGELIMETEFCAGGLDASKKLREFEEDLKSGGREVVCHDTF